MNIVRISDIYNPVFISSIDLDGFNLRVKLDFTFRRVEGLDSDVKLFSSVVEKDLNQVWKKKSTSWGKPRPVHNLRYAHWK